MLLGRGTETARLDETLAAVRNGRSDAIVLVGEPGVGKSALLAHVTEAAADLRVARAAGVESEMELAFAALHQLCGPLLAHLDRLPGPQAEAVATVFGLRAGAAPGTFLIGLGVLNLLAEAARDRPVVCVIDDAQWLDAASAQVLAFVARRLSAESVLMVFASRTPPASLDGLNRLTVGGLPDAAARKLLDSVVRWPLDDGVRAAILAESHGNPLALLELPLTDPSSLAGGFGLLDTSRRIEESFRHRVDELPAESRLMLLLAAADPVGDPVLLWRAAAALGVGRDVETGGLLTVGERVAFRHPLVRSAVYHGADPAERRAAHRALGAATPAAIDPDRRAWHLAQATAGEDETIAAELEASAGRAQARGGLAAAAAFRERAALLTGDPDRRADRELAAARDKYHAGSLTEARILLDRVEAGPPDDLRAAHVGQLRGHLAFATGSSAQAPVLLLDTARRFESLDPALARETYLDAITYALLAGRFAGRATAAEVAAAARHFPGLPERAQDLLVDALAVLYSEGHDKGTPAIRTALAAFLRDELPADEAMRCLGIACHAAYEVWDDDAWETLAELGLRHTRATGALVMLPVALTQRISAHLHAGEFAEASALVEEAEAVAEATGIARPAYDAATVPAWRGESATASALINAAMRTVEQRAEGIGLILIQQTNAVLLNGLGRFPEALRAAELATANPAESAFAAWALPELVEAAVRCGEHAKAAAAVERLALTTLPSGTDWGLGTLARSRALISDDADALFEEAVARLGRSRGRVALARAHLLYGEWLRPRGRTAEAKIHLRTAHELFTAMGGDAFAGRARQELVAAGETVAVRPRAENAELTTQEFQIARRARDGRSNAEIGAELFLSARTIEWHLRKVFTKLGVTSRRELRAALPGSPVPRLQ